MNLKIDTSVAHEAKISLDENILLLDRSANSSQVLLDGILSLVEKNGGWSKVSSITVNTGPGSYTGLRVGASVAQAISWYLQKPVNDSVIEPQNPFISLNYSIDNLK